MRRKVACWTPRLCSQYLQDEPGAQVVQAALVDRAVINIVNYAEVLSRLAAAGTEAGNAHHELQEQGLIGGLLELVALTEEDAVAIARSSCRDPEYGLSLGDRACLATALRLGWPVITADRNWSSLSIGVDVRLIRS